MIRYLKAYIGDSEIVVEQDVRTKMLHAGNQFEPADFSFSTVDLGAWINGKPFPVWEHPRIVKHVERFGEVTDFRWASKGAAL